MQSPRIMQEVRGLTRFATVGGLATGVHVTVIFVLARGLLMTPQAAHFYAFAISFAVSFIGHHRLSFRSTRSYRSAFVRFALVVCGAYAVSAGILRFLLAGSAVPYDLALLVAAASIPVLSYFLGRFWAFKND